MSTPATADPCPSCGLPRPACRGHEAPTCPAIGHRTGPCDLTAGHGGAHISYGYNGDRAWGIDYGRQDHA